MLHISPKGDTVAHLLPFALVFPYAFLALLDKWLHAVFLDLLFAIQAQQLFDLQFNGQAVGVPACFAQYVIPAHALIPRHQILKAARDQMADVRHPVGCRRPVEKAERRLVRLRRHGFFGNIVLLPKIQYLQFPGAKVHPGFYLLIHVFGPNCFPL